MNKSSTIICDSSYSIIKYKCSTCNAKPVVWSLGRSVECVIRFYHAKPKEIHCIST